MEMHGHLHALTTLPPVAEGLVDLSTLWLGEKFLSLPDVQPVASQ